MAFLYISLSAGVNEFQRVFNALKVHVKVNVTGKYTIQNMFMHIMQNDFMQFSIIMFIILAQIRLTLVIKVFGYKHSDLRKIRRY